MPDRRSPLVFVVDDDFATNQTLQGILAQAGFATAGAADAAGALAGVRERRPDLVLLDVNLPDGNGLEVCQELQRQAGAGQMPVLFISANDELAAKIRGFEAGGVDYIPKPFAGEEVIARVSTHLRLKHAYESLAELQSDRIQRLALAQEALMPSAASLPDARFEVCLKQVWKAGGDFYDVIPVGEHIVDYVVADASGHDLAASFWTAALKTLLSEYATAASSPREILRAINNALGRNLPPGMYFTLVYARLNRRSGKLCVATAGHPPAVLVRKNAATPVAIRAEGDVLGAFGEARFGVTELKTAPEDRLFLFSDGLIEHAGSREVGLERLSAACARTLHAPMAHAVQAVMKELEEGAPFQDDVVLMGVEV